MPGPSLPIGHGRNCLVLTRRVAHLEVLAGLLTALGHQPLVMQGGMPAAARRAAVDRVLHIGNDLGVSPLVGEQRSLYVRERARTRSVKIVAGERIPVAPYFPGRRAG